MISLLRPALPGVLLIALAASALAESRATSKGGSIQGTIVDKRGYVMAGLTVTARNAATGAE